MKDYQHRPPQPEALQVLRDRARALARPPKSALAPQASLEVLEFHLATERYAMETRHVRGVLPLKNLTPLPCTPPFVAGIVNVRGRIVAVLDFRKFFNLPEQGLTDLHRVILVGSNDLEVGLLADMSVSVRHLLLDSLQPALPTLSGIHAQYLMGVTAERIVVLNMARILADPTMLVHQEVKN